jgi:hypothetical protein
MVFVETAQTWMAVFCYVFIDNRRTLIISRGVLNILSKLTACYTDLKTTLHKETSVVLQKKWLNVMLVMYL